MRPGATRCCDVFRPALSGDESALSGDESPAINTPPQLVELCGSAAVPNAKGALASTQAATMNEKEKKLPTFADFLAAGLQDSEDVQQVVCGLLIDLCANLRLSGVLLNQMDRVVEPLERMVQKNSKQVRGESMWGSSSTCCGGRLVGSVLVQLGQILLEFKGRYERAG